MAVYKKSGFVQGKWIKASDIKAGTRCYLTAETSPVESQFKDRDGKVKYQDVSKIHLEGSTEIFNVSINRATLNALVDAYGEDSKNWVNKVLVAEPEKMIVSGRRIVALYLVPDGYEKSEDENGYVVITKKGVKNGASLVSASAFPDGGPEGEDVRPEDLPF